MLAIVEAGGQPHALTHELDTVGRATWARSPAVAPRTRTRTRRPASSTASPTAGRAATWSTTPWSGSTAGCGTGVEIEVTGSPMIRTTARPTEHCTWSSTTCRSPSTSAWSRGEPPRPVQAVSDRLIDQTRRARRTRAAHSWDADYPARIGLLPRRHGRGRPVVRHRPCYVFHTSTPRTAPTSSSTRCATTGCSRPTSPGPNGDRRT